MKRTLHLLILVFALSSVKAQTPYFTENFDDAAAGQLTGTTTSAPTSPVTYTLSSGAWTFYYAFRSGSGCENDPAPVSAKAIRILQTSVTSPAGIVPPAYMITPTVNTYGISTVTFDNAKNTSGSTTGIYKSRDGGATWTLVLQVPTTANVCDAYTVTVNDALANKIKFTNDNTTAQLDLDHVTINSFSNILPVKFAGFSATETSGKVKLNWNIASELNAAKYVVERSSGNGAFSEVGSLPAGQYSSYNWIDYAPNSGVNLYRIRAVDKDGASIYTSVVKISLGKKAMGVAVTPNPVKGTVANIQLQNFVKGSYILNLYNAAGQQVLSSSISLDEGSSSYPLQLPSSVKAGLYNLQIKNGETVVNTKVIVQ